MDPLLLKICLASCLSGLVLIGVGVYVQVATIGYLNFLSGQYLIAPVFIIIIGTLILLTVFFSFEYGREKRIDKLLGFLLFFILIGNIGAGIASFVLRGDLEDAINTNMQYGMTNNTATWDMVQENFKCCGLEGKDDWNDTYPDSCCFGGKKQDCGKSGHELYEDGCVKIISEFFLDNLHFVGVTAFCVAAAEVLLICFACGLFILFT